MTNPNAIFEVLRSRRSIREFTDRRPTREEINRIIEAACWAPSNHNRQGWKFLVFEDAAAIHELAEHIRAFVRDTATAGNATAAAHLDELVYYAGLFENAPVVILAMHKQSAAVARPLLNGACSALVSGEALSTAMAVQNLCLAAYALGLGTCVMTAPLLAGEVWHRLPDMPEGFESTCLVTVGYPATQPEMPRRKALKHVIEYR